MRAKTRWIAPVLLLFLPFCKTATYTNAPKPDERYTSQEEKPLVSTIVIPVDISMEDLVRSINIRVQGTLYEDLSYSDNGNDGLMLKAVKARDITLFFSGQTIKYKVPLKLWIKKDLLVTDVEAEGELDLNLKTNFSINPDWSLRTTTEVEYHEWAVKPYLRTGLGNLSIESIANLVLNKSKKTLSQTLDRIVSQQLSLKPFVQEAWDALQQPTLLSEEYQMWMKNTPMSIGMTPITTDFNNIRARIAVDCINDVQAGSKPAFRPNTPLPNLRLLDEAPDDFQMRISTEVPFAEAERLAQKSMFGQEFSSGKRKVRVDNIQLWGNNDKIVVNTRLSGSFNGNIYFIGRPVYNAQRNRVEMADLDFHVDTRNFLHRTASWLFQGTIKRQMTAAMQFPLDEDIRELRATVQQSLERYEIQPGVVLRGTVDSLTVESTRVTQKGIRVDLFSQGKLLVEVKGL